MNKKPSGPGVYSATYSGVPVYEFQFGESNKEHVMRRRVDDYINATHILKAANLDKPGRTRILERDVQKNPNHEKIQGGYGKYQGTWIPLEAGESLAHRHGVFEKLRVIFEFQPGNTSPPPAPKHTTNKPKAPKAKPAVPKWGSGATAAQSRVNHRPAPVPPPTRIQEEYYEDNRLHDEGSIPDDNTVASVSFMGEDDRYDMSLATGGSRKRKREDELHRQACDAHMVYGDELLDYFMANEDIDNARKPEPPPNFQPDWPIDGDGHTPLHWAAAMGDIDVMKQMQRFGAKLDAPNNRGETPLMRCVLFTNCQEHQAMPMVVGQLIMTIDAVDHFGSTTLHHAAAVTVTRVKHQCARYYLDVILNKMQEVFDPHFVEQIIDAQDTNGNTAIHIAAKFGARKCVRALMGRGARTDIPNDEDITADELISELNNSRQANRQYQASSSPFAPESDRRVAFHDALTHEEQTSNRHATTHHSEAAMSVESKITPMVLEKFQELARSFDDELLDKDRSEKESKRILDTTNEELLNVRQQIGDLNASATHEVDLQSRMARELEELKKKTDSILEKQQDVNLRALDEDIKQSQINGNTHGHGHPHVDGSNGDITERLALARQVNDLQNKRQKLVHAHSDALSKAGAGENGALYRRLISRSLDIGEKEVEMMDENLDSLIENLGEDLAPGAGGNRDMAPGMGMGMEMDMGGVDGQI